ncbi:hypothetical protein N3K66_001716 [Trichothecium roseum]|uniref:Uncharacterized protein n=1 Tax=Trichothecium roseum TaxID=47278 RepID=A0ACC0V7K0_9HYPO|nr:hypothetical protein N3K66_001716 [Trichothecium roseum]
MSSPFGFLQYLRLKLVVSLMRFANYFVRNGRHYRPSPSCVRKPVRIPSRDLRRFIDAWVYYPPGSGSQDGSSPDLPPMPLVVNWHGSAMILPNLGMDHAFCERLAREAGVLVLDADYRKAPEDPFPAAVEDVEDALRWVAGQPRLFDPDRVAFSGFSAGANLALVASSQLLPPPSEGNGKALNVRAVYAFYPGVDFTIPPETKTTIASPIAPLPIFAQHLFYDCYAPRHPDRSDPRMSPLRADPSTFASAKVMLFPCSGDVLGPETVAFGEKLRAAGCDAETDVVSDAAHGFDKTIKARTHNAPETERTYAKVVRSLKEVM